MNAAAARPQAKSARAPRPNPAAGEPTGRYRCGECGTGRDLTAWGNFSVHGHLGTDGLIESWDYEEQWELHESSIQCEEHPGAPLEKRIDDRWHGWWKCPRCMGAPDSRCPEYGIDPEPRGRARRHAAWWPLDLPWPASGLDQGGHVFPASGLSPVCRHCNVLAESKRGSELPCEGDRHSCPVITEEGHSATTRQMRGSADWVCLQPGAMNPDFTEWRCRAGHIIARAAHVAAGRRHETSCPVPQWCPWESLVEPAA